MSDERRLALALVSPALLWTLAFFAVPFAAMLLLSFAHMEGRTVVQGLSLANYAKALGEPSHLKALINSVEITVTVTVVSVALAWPLAATIAWSVPARWQRAALLMAVLPFWTSYVVRSYSWALVLGKNGVVNQAFGAVGLGPFELASTRFATVLGFTHFFVMLLTLTIYANLIQLSPNYARAAQDLGAGRLRTLWHVILPLTLPGIVTGAFVTFVLCIGDYITPQILGGNTELTLPQLIMLQMGRGGNFPMASALSVILMAVVTLAYAASARWLRLDRL
ncbi:ABC transporter permease [Rhodobacter sp. KR11]|uniref:ABC transporter permease n=1 Tax=Rhodobacter sp. KR11 TaxID=2974588 RepID=UPI0022213F76|nr:ABC transporter permease [Rhodobacter sp. KR11]MCW1917321.1 ABC transporter permease [Rhodobacter sp. KR11]